MENIEQRIVEITNDREHGSRWLVRETLALLHELATDTSVSSEQALQQLRNAGQRLMQARPAMAALAGAVERVLYVSDHLPNIAQEAERLLADYNAATARIMDNARSLLKGILMTHSMSGTVLDVLVGCRHDIERIIVLEGRPRYEGRDLARQLARNGIAVTLITDAQADIFLPECRAVVVGADTILANGDVINKAGTALLAWAARGHKVPLYVLSETLKISPRRWSGDLVLLEEKEPEEVLEQPIAGVVTRNFYFDRTPARLITSIITEKSVMGQRAIQQEATALKRMLKSRER